MGQVQATRGDENARSESAKSMQREIASLMPDPQGSDSLLDTGGSSSSGVDWGYNVPESPMNSRMQNMYDDLLTGSDLLGRNTQRSSGQNYMSEEEFNDIISSLPPAERLQEMQWRTDLLARQEWEADQAQEKAFEVHSDQLEASNRYEICMRLGDVMNDIEQHDYYNSDDGQDSVPSWIRAHFILESELEQERSGLLPTDRVHLEQEVEETKEVESLLPGVDDSFLQLNSMDDLLMDVLGPATVPDKGTRWSPPSSQQRDNDGEDSDDEEVDSPANAMEAAEKKAAAGRSMLDDVMDYGNDLED